MIRAESEYRHELPYHMNMEIQKQYKRDQYKQYCDEQQRLKTNAGIISKAPRVRQKQLSITDIQMKVRFYENRSRKKLLALFEEERAEYEAKRPRHSIDDQIAFMEKRAAEIQQTKQEQQRLFAERMYELQQMQNNVELREARQRLNDAECRIAWDLQRHQLIERRKIEREIQMKLDQIVIDDYKAHLLNEEKNRQELVQRAKANAAALQQQMDLQTQRKAAEKAREIEMDYKALMLEQQRKEIERLEHDLEAQKAALLQEELQIQIYIQEQKRLNQKRELYRDGQKMRELAEAEAKALREKKIQDQHDLFQLQTIYCAQVAERKKEVQIELKALEDKMIAIQRAKDEEQLRVERERLQKQFILAKDCETWNINNAKTNPETILQEKINKQKELEQALEELRLYEEDKLRQMKNELVKQQALKEWLTQDIERKQRLLEREKEEQRKETEQEVLSVCRPNPIAQAEVQRINQLMQEINQIPMYQAPRPRPKRQWYH